MITTELPSGSLQCLAPPRHRQVAVMFADLDHFTRICSEDPPEFAFRLVRDFQRVVVTSVSSCGGRIRSYSGDGAMATFGDLTTGRNDSATRALRCARRILEEIVALEFEHVDPARRSVSISIGLQYGSTLVGPTAGSSRFGPTVIGDAVNVASRLEQRARVLNATLVVGDDLVQRALRESGPEALELAQLAQFGPLSVDGRNAPVVAWILPSLQCRPSCARA
jgi:adenylate cyclase